MNGKFLSDCEITSYLEDKFLIVTKSGGEDYKISYGDLLANLSKTFLRNYLKSKIGSLHINTNNQYIDSTKYNDGYLEYLMLNGQTIKKEEYPDLFRALKIEEATYTLPNYWQEEGGCTLKHVKQGSGRGLNSYERDEVKTHAHSLNLNNIQTETFDIDLNHRHNIRFFGKIYNVCGLRGLGSEGVLKAWDKGKGYLRWESNEEQSRYTDFEINVNQDTSDSYKLRSEPITVKVKPYSGFTNPAGQKENTVKNIAVQCYIIAKVLV